MKISKESRVLGGLIGIAYGDAFGMPGEGFSRSQIKKKFGRIERFLPGLDENPISKGLQAGEFTDDTMNTIFVIEMLKQNNLQVNAYDFIKRLRNWTSTSEKSFAVTGPSTKKAFELIEQGVPMEETGKTGTTNGAAMKILPVGMVNNYKNLDALIEQVHLLSMPTHNTSIAISGASAVAAAESYALFGNSDLNEMIQVACNAAEQGSSLGHELPSPSIAARIKTAIGFADNYSKEEAIDIICDVIGTDVAISESVPATIAFAYLAEGNPYECAVICANAGGDTDTIAAMACGICGTLQGDAAFKQEDIALLEEVNQINFRELAEGLGLQD
ncbi:ADP-ribosylglycohydrolase family protein [Virgibacillus sp. YIM 98842]|uniref:ADP-ribosylglycohydrolase family protein n=1 Tax=Virgibacillus sp. YIM 98842 TaxID=2663533 RepID=UPI0013DBFAFE|nr:ADP-ribosylglycohydrolase family protein [Virgibacillus sp. YIM 98842]